MTVSQWLTFIITVVSQASASLYAPYWRMMAADIGDMDLSAVKPTHILRIARKAQQSAVTRQHNQSGIYAFEHVVSAARKAFDLALRDGLVSSNPALMVEEPRRPQSRRHALTTEQIAEMFDVATDVDTVALRFMLETGCRREGLCNLSPDKIRPDRQTVILDEKGSRRREQPISVAMLAILTLPDSPVMGWTRRRLDGLWMRQHKALTWSNELGVPSHWMRHTAITRIERVSGYAIAAAFAGHEAKGTTATYINVTIHDVASAFTRLYGESHPLAPTVTAKAAE